MPFSHKEAIPDLGDVIVADSQRRIDVTAVLRRRQGKSSGVAMRPHVWTREAFAEWLGADPQDIAAVVSFFTAYGLHVDLIDANARCIRVSGAAASFERAFGTTFLVSESGYQSWVGHLFIPKTLLGILEAVVGLDDRPILRPFVHVLDPEGGGSQGTVYSPPEVAALYQFPLEYKGNGQRIAILEFGGGYRDQDLEAYFANLELSPNVTSRSVDGGKNSPKKLSRPTLEVNLDVDVIGSLAPNAAIVVFFAKNNQKGFIDAFAEAVHGADFRPTVISISWGGSEKHWHSSSITAINNLLEDASTLRISVCASAGDWGSSDHDSGLNVIFPASSPYALACGGTMISVSDGVLVDESVWHDKYGVTGGGVSKSFARPTWQSETGVPPLKGKHDFLGRGIPDIAGNADPDSGYAVGAYGKIYAAGGTSAVSPLWASLIALLNDYLDSDALGFMNPFLYSDKEMHASCRDITRGNNGAYEAGIGWDACTGWGSPHGSRILSVVARWYFAQTQMNCM